MIPFKVDNPTNNVPFVTIGLIIANIIVFVWEILTPMEGEQIALLYGAIPHNLVTFRSAQMVSPLVSVFTSMFLHGGFFHIAGNMLFLWIFGDNIEDALGHFRFLVFYLFSGVVAAYGNALTDPQSTLPMIVRKRCNIGGVRRLYSVVPSCAGSHPYFLWFFLANCAHSRGPCHRLLVSDSGR